MQSEGISEFPYMEVYNLTQFLYEHSEHHNIFKPSGIYESFRPHFNKKLTVTIPLFPQCVLWPASHISLIIVYSITLH